MLTETAALLFNDAAIRATSTCIDSLNPVFNRKVQTASRYLQKYIPLTVCRLAVLEAAL
jgi:hypothetical protein